MSSDLICPDCRGDLKMTDAQWAVCAQHGGRYEVLFDRYAVPAESAASAGAAPPPRRRTDVPDGPCADHPGMPAVARCRLCAKAVCATCDFALPGGVHLCPACIESQSTQDVSPKRKKLSYIGMALGIWSTILFLLLLGGAFNSLFTADEAGTAADLLITNLILWPLLIGTGVSFAALDKKLKNTALMRVVAWWNGVLGAIFLLVVVAANLGAFG